MGEEQCAYRPGAKAPVGRFDNYKWRGPHLADLAFFEYYLEFDPKHPKYGIYVQRLARKKSQVTTVTFNGQLSEFQAEEEAVLGGHPVTAAIQNDFAEVLLGLFVLWNRLPDLFRHHAVYYEIKREACARIWAAVERTLSLHNYNFASNIELLRKSKEDSRIDTALRGSVDRPDDSFDRDIDDAVPADMDLNTDEPLDTVNEDFSTETLIAAYYSIAMSWRKESLVAGQRIPTLLSRASQILSANHIVALGVTDQGSRQT
ncbi:hypothetical protein BKA61DRAFT_742494 [Leptodontidium sp. MPI-SDFR-AT-0119]|nr:hypothetical protein BKA61DRAFT_742494 [Leptodontidium sp. MPI-SDFR-AT-0119]